MVIRHALIASVVEGLVTALVVAYLMRSNQSALSMVHHGQIAPEASGFAKWRALWVGLAALIVITPIGLLAPGTAWGEWGAEELTKLGLFFIPKGLEQLSGLWSAPMPDYQVTAVSNANIGYILSAVVGVLITIIIAWLFSMLITNGKKSPPKISQE